MTDDNLNRDLEQMAGNPATARAIKSALDRLKNGAAGSDLAEMARDLLDGRIQLRDLGKSSAYAEPLTEAVGGFQQWQAALTDEERREQLETAREQLGLSSEPNSSGTA
uniref:hypothetical protein n=1 Tax=Paractinoplanes polyasparticus TaxID=2856853 RepID=UPI001C8443F6|nr:hypothetical protein [Actinoplanes polyasparticus]